MNAMAWAIITATLVVSLGVDLFVHRRGHGTSARGAAVWMGIWFALAAAFGLLVLVLRGGSAMQDYFAAYLLEESLSVDNLFVFMMIFEGLRVPPSSQHRVLFFGVLGALIFRAAFIIAGAAALESWRWLNFVFGGILLVAAVRAVMSVPAGGENRFVRWLSRNLPVSERLEGGRFFVRRSGKILATPLVVALIGLEVSDLVFAIDSVPAALSISGDRFVIYSSNALAICGLRSLYLVLRGVLRELPFLHHGIAAVLLFTGLKMISHHWVSIPSWVSITVTLFCIGASVGFSLRMRRAQQPAVAASYPPSRLEG
jgi:TerC family integral membrane protein